MVKNSSIFYIFLFFILGFLLACFLQTCQKPISLTPSHTEIIVYDTIYRDTGKIYYLPSATIPKPVKTIKIGVLDSLICMYNRMYVDSVRDSSVVIYSKDSVNGVLLSKKISYRLLGIKQINQTTTIIDSIPYPVNTFSNRFYLSTEAGTNGTKFQVSVGADYIGKKKYGLGYRYSITDRTHNVSFKLRAF